VSCLSLAIFEPGAPRDPTALLAEVRPFLPRWPRFERSKVLMGEATPHRTLAGPLMAMTGGAEGSPLTEGGATILP
jgi:hypothetical protein